MRKILIVLTLLVSSIVVAQPFLQLQPIAARHNYNALLEPADKIMLGAGQVQKTGAFPEYWSLMPSHKKPSVFMVYTGLDNCNFKNWAEEIREELKAYGDTLVALQIGLSLTQESQGSSSPVPYTNAVVNGSLNENIEVFLDALQELGRPVYLRIGYEFNGTSWNGYQAASYKNAFIYLTNKIRQRPRLRKEVATVWCSVASGGNNNFIQFYPGDAYVDWWGIDLFSATDFTNTFTNRFMDSSVAHQKPVMIGEATPRFVGVLNGQNSWTGWFLPYFNFIHTRPNVKMTNYINWNWANYPQWANWGDARLSQNAVVRNYFIGVLDSAAYLHTEPEPAFRKKWIDNGDTTPPSQVTSIQQPQLDNPFFITWGEGGDTTIATYRVRIDPPNQIITTKNNYIDVRNLKVPVYSEVYVTPIDQNGNVPQPPFVAVTPMLIVNNCANKIKNGGFEMPLRCDDEWRLFTTSGASATAQIDSNNAAQGNAAVRLDILQKTGTNWHAQFWHTLRLYSDRNYQLQFQIKGSSSGNVEVFAQKNKAPHTVYMYQNRSVTTNFESVTYNLPNINDTVNISFVLGGDNVPNTVWIDNVIVRECMQPNSLPQAITKKDYNIYPNPTSDRIYVTGNDVQTIATIHCTDISGKIQPIFWTKSKDNLLELQVAHLSQGIYMLQIIDNQQNILHKKIVKY